MRKLLAKRLTALLFVLLLFSALVIMVPAAVDSDNQVKESLKALSEDIKSKLPKEAFGNPKSAEGQRRALCNKIDAVIHQIEAGANKGAVNKLKNDISNAIIKWIADQVWETYLLEKVNEIIKLIKRCHPPNLPPVAEFSESAETVLTGVAISFNASASYDPDGCIVSYFWDFCDGAKATGVIVAHAYADDGVYTVALTVTDDDGATETATSTKTVLNRPPVAIFTESAESVPTCEIIYFNASDSYDPDGYIVSYFWDFGDGTNSTGVTTDHSYAEEGTYTVTLTVTDDDGATASTNATKIVGNIPPVAEFSESAETVLTGVAISFNASASYDPDGTIVSYFWDFGDEANATGVTTSHSYADDGIYTVTLTVTDDDGAVGSTNATKMVSNRPPVASFTENATTVLTGEVIHFNASTSYDPDGTIVNYTWNFGDGNTTTVTTPTITHAYTDNGTYTVTLTVTDDDGATASTNATKIVGNIPPVAEFSESAETVYTGTTISFNASASYDPDGYIISYFWDFGDGTNATDVIVDHAYTSSGAYTVILKVTDNNGAVDFASSTKTVLSPIPPLPPVPPNKPPVAVFIESATTVFTNDTVKFIASASYDLDGTIVSYSWNFGDGNVTTGVSVEHSYADDGNYTVTFTVTDDDGATDTATSTKYVLNRPPVANFTESAENIYTDEVVTFNATGSYDPDGVVNSYFWDFGDGTSATGTTMDHAYADDGVYIVTLTVTDDDGSTATATSIKTVLNRPPFASFTESATTVLTGETIDFDASGSEDPDGHVIFYVWNFGDGASAAGVSVNHAYEDDGIYTVNLTVVDDDGASASDSAVMTVLNRAPVASFTESAETVLSGVEISFDASESYDPDGTIVGYFWEFGDGTNATEVAVDHAYAEEGNYTVTLTVTDDDGASGSVDATKMVEKEEVVAGWPLALLAAIGLGVAALTATLLYALYRRRKKRSASSSGSSPIVTFYVPMKMLTGYLLGSPA